MTEILMLIWLQQQWIEQLAEELESADRVIEYLLEECGALDGCGN